jgi:hypothetical protein
MNLGELKNQVDELLKSYTEETQVIITGNNRQTFTIIRDLKVEIFDVSRRLIVGGMNSNNCELVVTIKSNI